MRKGLRIMRGFILRQTLHRLCRGIFVASAFAFAVSLTPSPAAADWHHGCWGCGPHVSIGLGFYPPPVYYGPPAYYYPSYYPPPVVVAPPPPPPVIVQSSPSCTWGQWRQEDGSIVNGVACRQPDGSWKLQ